jgi:hypothetical protein
MKSYVTNDVHSTIQVKQGFSLSPTFLGIYIDELEEIIENTLGVVDGCLFFGVSIAIIPSIDDIILMYHSMKGHQRQLYILGFFCDTHKLEVKHHGF